MTWRQAYSFNPLYSALSSQAAGGSGSYFAAFVSWACPLFPPQDSYLSSVLTAAAATLGKAEGAEERDNDSS